MSQLLSLVIAVFAFCMAMMNLGIFFALRLLEMTTSAFVLGAGFPSLPGSSLFFVLCLPLLCKRVAHKHFLVDLLSPSSLSLFSQLDILCMFQKDWQVAV